MASNPVPRTGAANAADIVKGAIKRFENGEHDLVLDFSDVRRIDCVSIRALEELAENAAASSGRIVLRGVQADVYKVIKLMAIAPRFSFSI